MIRRIIQLILLPLFIPLSFIYADMLKRQSTTVFYAWYRSRKDFDAVDHSNEPEEGDLRPKTWLEWQKGAEETENAWRAKGNPFIKVVVKPEHLFRWLRENQLANTSSNRERYVLYVYAKACNEGIELARKKH